MNKIANPEMITLARESRGLTQTELAKALGVTQAAISKAEKFSGKVSGALVKDMALVLDYPESFFYQQGFRYAPATPLLHRKQKSLPVKVENKVEAEANIRRLQIGKLLDSVELPEKDIPQFDLEDFEGPEGVAQALRSKFRLPRGPVQNMTDLVESLGIIILLCRFDSEKLDGFTIFGSNKPIIYLNQEMPWCRLRFTLAHELGHIIMGHVPGPTIEEEANDFASAFLMPQEDIRRDFNGERIDLNLLANLKPRWKVSMQALLFRAMSIHYLTKNQSSYLWMAISQAGYKKREPSYLDIPPEHPKLFKSIIDAHLTELEYTKEELNQVLVTNTESFNNLYPFLVPKQKKIIRLFDRAVS